MSSADPALQNKGSLLDLDVGEEEGGEREKLEMKRLIGELEERLGRLSRFKKERAVCLDELKHLVRPCLSMSGLADCYFLLLICISILQIQNDDVSQQLLVNRRAHGGEPTLFAAELEKFKPFQNRLDNTIEHEKSTLKEISQFLDDLTGLKGARETQDQWQSAEQNVKELTRKLGRQLEDYREASSALR